MDMIPSLIASMHNRVADQLDRNADWDEGHKHESGTTAEWEARTEANRRTYRQARASRWAAKHYLAMWQ